MKNKREDDGHECSYNRGDGTLRVDGGDGTLKEKGFKENIYGCLIEKYFFVWFWFKENHP